MQSSIAHSILAACLLASLPDVQALPSDKQYQQALDDHKVGRWASAYGRLVELADHGDPDAARICLFMHRYGPQLYGAYWDATPDQLKLWERLATDTRGRPNAPFDPTTPARQPANARPGRAAAYPGPGSLMLGVP